jgi:hypothetical protein
MIGRGQVCVPFQLSGLREIKKKKNLDSSTDAPDQYIQAFISVIQIFKLAWQDIMLLLYQTLFTLKKQWVLAQALRLEMITIYNEPQYLWHPW